MNKRKTGAYYERQAIEYLKANGYKILEKNYWCSHGEIDIIAEDSNQTIVYCEVKYRKSKRYGDPAEAVGPRKRRVICRAALYHYSTHLFQYTANKDVRFDVIGFLGDDTIKHVKDAFTMQGSG